MRSAWFAGGDATRCGESSPQVSQPNLSLTPNSPSHSPLAFFFIFSIVVVVIRTLNIFSSPHLLPSSPSISIVCMNSNSQTFSVACVIPADVEHRTPHTSVVTESWGADGHGIVFHDPRSGPIRFTFDLCIHPTKGAQPQDEDEEGEKHAIASVPSSEEMYDELCRDAVEYLVKSVLGGTLSSYRQFTLICSDWECNTASISCFGQDEDGGLLADILAKLLPYFKKGKKKKKSPDPPANPQITLRASIVKGATLAAVEGVLGVKAPFDAPLPTTSASTIILDEVPTSVGEALNVIASARGDGTPGITVVRLSLQAFGQTSSHDYCTISVVTVSAAPQLLNGVAAALVPSPQYEGWQYPPQLVSVLNIQSVYRSALQEVQHVLKEASHLRGHGPPAAGDQSRQLSKLCNEVDISSMSTASRLHDELAADIRVARLQRAKGASATSSSSTQVKNGGTDEGADLTVEELLENYRQQRKSLEIAADLFDYEALVEEKTTLARRAKRSRLKAEDEVAKLQQSLADLKVAEASLVAPSKAHKSKKAKKKKKKVDDFDASSSSDEGPVVDELTTSERAAIMEEDEGYTRRLNIHPVADSFYANWKVWSVKQDELLRAMAGSNHVRAKLLQSVKSPEIFASIVKSASSAAVSAVSARGSKKKSKGPTSPAELEFDALLEKLTNTPAQPGAFASPNRVRMSTQLAEDIVEFIVERAALIGEGVVDRDESYAWFDIEGASRRLKGSAVWERPLAVTIHEYFPNVTTEVPEGTILGSSDDEEVVSPHTKQPPKVDKVVEKPANVEDAPPPPRKDKTSKSRAKAAETTSDAQGKSTGDASTAQATSSSSTTSASPQPHHHSSSSSSTKKHDTEESDKRYLMAVYDSLTLVQDVTKYLKAGTVMLKHGRSGDPHDRLFWIATVGHTMDLLWMDNAKKDSRSSISLPEVSSITLGPFSKVFKRHKMDHSKKEFFLSFTLTMRDGSRTVDIVAPSLPDFEAWILGLCHVARVDPVWGKPLCIQDFEKQKSDFAIECNTAAGTLSADELELCSLNYIFPSDYKKVKDRVEKIRDEVQLHMRLFANNAEQAFVALGGIHLPQINHKGAILMTKGELRHHCSRFNLDIFRVCEIWKHFSKISLVYDPSFTSATSFGVSQRAK